MTNLGGGTTAPAKPAMHGLTDARPKRATRINDALNEGLLTWHSGNRGAIWP